MTVAWRLASGRHPPLTGEGARLVGGRWNSPGRQVVYTSESLALCLAEALVHLPGRLPADYVALKLELPTGAVELLDAAALKGSWAADIAYTRAIGDQWIEQGRSLALAVPSAVLPASTNILINPAHARADRVRASDPLPFEFDPRLRPGS